MFRSPYNSVTVGQILFKFGEIWESLDFGIDW